MFYGFSRDGKSSSEGFRDVPRGFRNVPEVFGAFQGFSRGLGFLRDFRYVS